MNEKFNFTAFPKLETERLILRQPDQGDIPELIKLRSNESVNKFIERPKIATGEEVIKFLLKINSAFENKESFYWAIVQRNDINLIGTICLWNISKENNGAEIGYELHPDYQNRGIMQEAISCITDFAFLILNFDYIEAFTHRDNIISKRILEKKKFVIIGQHDAGEKEIVFRLEKSEYLK